MIKKSWQTKDGRIKESAIKEAQEIIETVLKECHFHGIIINEGVADGVFVDNTGFIDLRPSSNLAELYINRLHELGCIVRLNRHNTTTILGDETMEANDIIVSLHMHKTPSFLIEATSQALNERDAALAVLEEWQEISSAINCAIDDVGILRAENERLTKQAAEDSIKLLVFNEVIEERDAAIAALEMLRTSITQAPGIPTQENNWMLGIIDTALGDGPAPDRPHPLEPVEVD